MHAGFHQERAALSPKKNPKIDLNETPARSAETHWCICFGPFLRHLAGASACLLLADSWCAVVPTCKLFGVPPQSYDSAWMCIKH